MKRYIINAVYKDGNAPYIPSNYLQRMSIWRNNLSPTLTQCGFIHLGDCIVLGDESNLIEFKLTFTHDDDGYSGLIVITIKEFIDKPSYT